MISICGSRKVDLVCCYFIFLSEAANSCRSRNGDSTLPKPGLILLSGPLFMINNRYVRECSKSHA